MNAIEVKELTGVEAFDALSSTLQLAPLPDNAERLRLAQVFPVHGRQCDIPLKIARTIAHFAPPASLFPEGQGGRHG